MKFNRRLICLSLLALSGGVHADPTFPSKPIRIIVPFTTGGASDTMMRAIAAEMGKSLGQAVYVENRPGAAGAIGSIEVARAQPDGYTLLAGNNGTHIINSLLKQPAAYDAVKDFTPVALVQQAPLFIAVNPQLGVNTLRELITLAKSKPGQVTFASVGNAHTLAIEYLGLLSGAKFQIIPYKGPSQAQTDAIAGHVNAFVDTGLAVLPHTRAGKLKLLAVTSLTRVPNMHDVPAVAETYPGYDVVGTNALFAPARTPPAVVARLSSEVRKALALPNVRQMILDNAGQPAPGDGTDVARWLEKNTVLWRDVMDKTGVVLN
ncbi:Bug family tripartite tricarboxylate transporter substrate binding protein [Alicycliphilus denitrificans]|nr:tripartite tricarboxylate transporter substrate binding protein [Alicycliphilus denitrificans]